MLTIRLTGIRPTDDGLDPRPSAFGRMSADVEVVCGASEATQVDGAAHDVDYAAWARHVADVLRDHAGNVMVQSVAACVADVLVGLPHVTAVTTTVRVAHPHGVCADEVTASIERTAQADSDAKTCPGEDACDGGMCRHNRDEADAHVRPDAPRRAVVHLSGDRPSCESSFRAAIVALEGVPGNQIDGISPLYHVSSMSGSDGECAVATLSTRLDGDALSRVCDTIAQDGHGGIRVRVVCLYGQGADPSMDVRYPEATTTATVLAPWLDVDAEARWGADPVSYLLALAPDADRVGMLSDRWILGGSL